MSILCEQNTRGNVHFIHLPIHPSIYLSSVPHVLHRVKGSLPKGTWDTRWWRPWMRFQPITGHSVSVSLPLPLSFPPPISPPRDASLRKNWRNSQKPREKMQPPCTQGRGRNQTPTQPWRCEKNVLTTEPPFILLFVKLST